MSRYLRFLVVLVCLPVSVLAADSGDAPTKRHWALYCEMTKDCAMDFPLYGDRVNQPPLSPFPQVEDWNSVHITLWRSDCDAVSCRKRYRVDIDADGTVTFRGSKQIQIPGKHEDRIPRAEVVRLVQMFRKANFYAIPYDAMKINDVPEYATAISIDGRTKIVHTQGWPKKMKVPPMLTAVLALNDKIDKVTDSNKWISGTPNVIDSLKREGFDFDSRHADDIVFGLAEHGNSVTLKAFLAAGAELRDNNTIRLAYSNAIASKNRELIALFEKADIQPMQMADLYPK